jgi:hypothetical protein
MTPKTLSQAMNTPADITRMCGIVTVIPTKAKFNRERVRVMSESILNLSEAATTIKNAIVHSRYNAAKMVNKELLGLYYAVGKYVSENSRCGTWGTGAIKNISELLQKELPGLRGFSEVAIKRMRLFYEAWQPVFINRPLAMDDFQPEENIENRSLTVNEMNSVDLTLLEKHLNSAEFLSILPDEFYRVGFTHLGETENL